MQKLQMSEEYGLAMLHAKNKPPTPWKKGRDSPQFKISIEKNLVFLFATYYLQICP